MQMRFVYLCY